MFSGENSRGCLETITLGVTKQPRHVLHRYRVTVSLIPRFQPDHFAPCRSSGPAPTLSITKETLQLLIGLRERHESIAFVIVAFISYFISVSSVHELNALEQANIAEKL